MEQKQDRMNIFLSFLLLLPVLAHSETIDITKGLAKGADITEALAKAWKDVLPCTTDMTLLIPEGTWQLKQAILEGPNKSPIELKVKGTLEAPEGPLPDKEREWVTVNYVNCFTLSGGGVFDGKGAETWKKNDCHKNEKCAKMPYNLSFNFMNNSLIKDVTTKDSKNFHVNLIAGNNVTFLKFKVSAPAESPNTDGIHIARSCGVKVLDSIIETGDDCISMGDELKDVLIQEVKCGPGHGISIGSMGRNEKEKDVSGITIEKCTFKNTDNGVRIKTWPSAPATLTISDLKFLDLKMDNVCHPIIFDQQYCPHNLCSLAKPSLIQISKVKISGIVGSSTSQNVIIFCCSSAKPCTDIEVGDIDLEFIGDQKLGEATTKCENVKYKAVGTQKPALCVKTAPPKAGEKPAGGKPEKSDDKKSDDKKSDYKDKEL